MNKGERQELSIKSHIGYHEDTRRCSRCRFSYEKPIKPVREHEDMYCRVVPNQHIEVNSMGMCKLFKKKPMKAMED